MDLTAAQRSALAHVHERSSGSPMPPGLAITVQFHPDRLWRGRRLLDQIADDGRYRSQFETGTSNGGLTAHPGGDRWSWESAMFGGAYDQAPAIQRPVYGALNHRRRTVGGSPRFGSAHLVLRPAVLARSTFCFPDSAFGDVQVGTAERMGLITAADAAEHDALDDYIEAHVHGDLVPARDAEAVVLDACFTGTDTERAARRLGCAVRWHPGYALTVDELLTHGGYRGQRFVELGAVLAVDGVLTPDLIGAAARSGEHDEQDLKRVWHLLARFGAPRTSNAHCCGA